MKLPESLKILGCNAEKIRKGTGPLVKVREWVGGKLHLNCKTALREIGSQKKPRQEPITAVLEVSESELTRTVPTTNCTVTGCVFHARGACSTSQI